MPAPPVSLEVLLDLTVLGADGASVRLGDLVNPRGGHASALVWLRHFG